MNQPAMHSSVLSNLEASLRIKHRGVVAKGKDAVREAVETGAIVADTRRTADAGKVQESYDRAGVPRKRAGEYLTIYEGAQSRVPGLYGCEGLQSALALIKRHKESPGAGSWEGNAKEDSKLYRGMQSAAKKILGNLDKFAAAHTAREAEDVVAIRGMIENCQLRLQAVYERLGG